MLIPVREYASAAEMMSSIGAIRRGFRNYTRPKPAAAPVIVIAVKPPASALPKRVSSPPPTAVESYPEIEYRPQPTTVADVLRAVSSVWGMDRIHILSGRRTHDVMVPRHVVYALSCRLTKASFPQIGRAIGGRDHSTIHHGVKKMRPKVAAVEARIRPGATALEWAQEMRKEMGDPLSQADASKAVHADRPGEAGG
jgi:hypothetical protein